MECNKAVVYLARQKSSYMHHIGFLCNYTRSDTKKTRLTLQLGNEEWEGRDKQMSIEYVLTCHSVTRLSLITLLRKSGCFFKYTRVLILGRKMSDCKSEQELTSNFLLN